MQRVPPGIGIDATPLASGHAIRGIGRYLRGILDALWIADTAWAEANVGLLVRIGQDPGPRPRLWQTLRSPVRPQDVDPLIARVADRWAVRGSRAPRLWHHTDPAIPWSPLPIERTVVTAYDLIPLRVEALLERMRPHRRRAYRQYLDLVRRAKGIVAISAATADDVVNIIGVSADRIRVVPPFIPSTSGPQTRPSQQGTARFLFVGVPDLHKRPALAIDAFAEFIRRGLDGTLEFVGVHPPVERRSLVDRAAAAGMADRVRFVGRIGDADLRRRYEESVLLALSTIEGFGLPPVEAALAGGRVVATPTQAYRDSLDHVATFATDDSPIAVADAMAAAWSAEPTPAALTALAARHDAQTVAGALRLAYRELGGI